MTDRTTERLPCTGATGESHVPQQNSGMGTVLRENAVPRERSCVSKRQRRRKQSDDNPRHVEKKNLSEVEKRSRLADGHVQNGTERPAA